jgi:hypothetical protein
MSGKSDHSLRGLLLFAGFGSLLLVVFGWAIRGGSSFGDLFYIFIFFILLLFVGVGLFEIVSSASKE